MEKATIVLSGVDGRRGVRVEGDLSVESEQGHGSNWLYNDSLCHPQRLRLPGSTLHCRMRLECHVDPTNPSPMLAYLHPPHIECHFACPQNLHKVLIWLNA